MKVLVTGAAGFIGMHSARRLLERGDEVVGIDNLSPYYSVALKRARLERLHHRAFRFHEMDIVDGAALQGLFAKEQFDAVLHLAAQAGVRYSLEAPLAYVDANLVGFCHILEGARAQRVRHFVFASSSSVYGANRKLPFSESDNVDQPITLYGATKKANELAAHSYAHLFGLPCTGLRFFTVYGPWGRPDMALTKFTRAILAGEPIPVYNEGRLLRDFTYIDDVVEAIVRVMAIAPEAGEGEAAALPASSAPYRIFNVGNSRPVELIHYIRTIEACLGRTARLRLLPMQPGDMVATQADTSRLEKAIGYRPTTTVEQGIRRFVDWYIAHYGDPH